ncbi:RraA family protein [Actinokineospora iranica]|uniref:Putative 4-hydroxy-4-methyl-2-oxoglutarate aldolase n=1 Tax=Actinokineospora iranica TaxID=1271860 RepID=A0A1G6QYQ6_9PSEU|nr:RraA family protein [Actinokineospora iranica]SDC96877.1 Regulator of RNase E activity RraA [Actinokineospora iranica]
MVAVLRGHGTATVSDALDLIGVNGGLPGLRRLSGAAAVAGPAFTVRFETVEPGTPAPAADYIDDVPAGAVLVLANAGRTHCTVWGDILSEVALRRGVAGTVIDGLCRDLGDIQALDYPLWSLGSYMKSGKNRVRMIAAQRPVTVCGTVVAPGDVVCADAAGAVVVPAAAAERVAAEADRIAVMEAAVRADAAKGMPLREARRRHGYNRAALSSADADGR